VHSMGILLEADYKGVLQGKESPISGLRKAFGPSERSQNPLQRKEGESIEKGAGGELSYEVMNRDSAIALAQESSKSSVGTFLYISAAAGFPLLPPRYISSKRDAESIIATSFPKMRSIFFRPAFLYDSSRSFTLPIAGLSHIAAAVNGATGGRLSFLMGAGGTKPLKADVVGDAVVEAISESATKGVIETAEIEELAQKAWRGGML
jgi:hypothetical protein